MAAAALQRKTHKQAAPDSSSEVNSWTQDRWPNSTVLWWSQGYEKEKLELLNKIDSQINISETFDSVDVNNLQDVCDIWNWYMGL